MILHLSAAGVPVSWTIEAVYRSSYGIAHAAAKGWHDQSMERGETPQTTRDEPQYVVELKGDDETGWTVSRSDLFMHERHLQRQTHDQPAWLVQAHTAPMALTEPLETAIADALRSALIEFGYMIPRATYETRYPAQVLISRRFADFNAAHDAWRAAHPDRDDRMPFELKWAPFMEAPEDAHFPYSTGFVTTDGQLVEHDATGVARPVVVHRTHRSDAWAEYHHDALIAFPDVKGAQDTARLLNSGWTPEEVAILLHDEPIG